MKKLLILTVLIVNLLIVSQYSKADTYCSSGANNWGNCSAWYGGHISKTWFKSGYEPLYVEFTYSLENPGESDYVSGLAYWATSNPSITEAFRVNLNKFLWDIDPSPRLDSYFDMFSIPGDIYIDVYASGYPLYGHLNEITGRFSWL